MTRRRAAISGTMARVNQALKVEGELRLNSQGRPSIAALNRAVKPGGRKPEKPKEAQND